MQYEIEVKSLLGTKAAADALIVAMKQADPTFHHTATHTQLNHYFINGELTKLVEVFDGVLDSAQCQKITEIATKATSINVRSRQRNDDVLLIVKGSLDDRSAAHSLRRMEFEEIVDLTIDQLDEKILSADFELEAKWSAERVLYAYKDVTVDMLFSPGYGYMVELEKVVHDEAHVEAARTEILHTLKEFGLQEFDNARLERMFAYYNQHWQEYYGTDKTFTIE